MKKLEFIIVFQVLLVFNLIHNAAKNNELTTISFKLIYKLSDFCNCMVDTWMDSQRQLATAKTFILNL